MAILLLIRRLAECPKKDLSVDVSIVLEARDVQGPPVVRSTYLVGMTIRAMSSLSRSK